MSRSSHPRPAQRLWELVSAESHDVWVVLVYAVAVGVLSLATPVGVQALVNTVAQGALLQPLAVLTLLVFLGLMLSGLLRALQTRVVELLQQRLFSRVALHVFHRIRGADQAPGHGSHSDPSHGPPHYHYFYDVMTAQKSVAGLMLDGTAVVLQAVVGMIVLAFYHPLLLGFDVVLCLCLAILLGPMGRGAVATSIAESRAKHAAAAWLLYRASHPDAAEPEAHLHAERLLNDYLAARRAHFRVLFRQIVGALLLQAVASAALLGLGGTLVIGRQLTLGQLVAAEVIVTALLASVSKLGKHLENLYDLLAALDKLGHLSDELQTSAEAEAEVVAPLHGPRGLLPGTVGPAAAEALQRVPQPRASRVTGRLIGAGLGALAAALLLVPWQQNVRSSGRVVAYAPLDRQQTIEAPIEGRIRRWAVREGSRVKAGDVVVEIADNDPDLMTRLREERDAQQARLVAAEERARAVAARIQALTESRTAGVNAAGQRAQMGTDRLRASEQALAAAVAAESTARLNLERQQALFDQGLTSRRSLELAQLDEVRGRTEMDRARATLQAAQREVAALQADRSRVGTDVGASVSDAQAALAAAQSEAASVRAELARLDVRLARQATQVVTAPRAGTILRLVAAQGSEMVKAGDPLAVLVPETEDRAAEIWVDGNDVPLLSEGRRVRLQFEGWPAVQFAGWPSVAVGTFGGRVVLIDAADDGQGRFRVLVLPDEGEAWPSGRYLRQGVRVNGWILLNRVRLGYELWRQFNGFPPVIAAGEPGKADGKAGGKAGAGGKQ